MNQDEQAEYLAKGGWYQNRSRWWHPPNCTASFPLDQAYRMALDDARRGLRVESGDGENRS